jgi:hypothetical protein
VLENVLKFGDHHDDCSLGAAAVTTGFLSDVFECYLSLTDSFGIIFSIAGAALDVVPD